MSKCTHEWTSRSSGRCLHCKAVTVSPSQQADRIATLERELAAVTAERDAHAASLLKLLTNPSGFTPLAREMDRAAAALPDIEACARAAYEARAHHEGNPDPWEHYVGEDQREMWREVARVLERTASSAPVTVSASPSASVAAPVKVKA